MRWCQLLCCPSQMAMTWRPLTLVYEHVPQLIAQAYLAYDTYIIFWNIRKYGSRHTLLYGMLNICCTKSVYYCCIKISHLLHRLMNVCGVTPVKWPYFNTIAMEAWVKSVQLRAPSDDWNKRVRYAYIMYNVCMYGRHIWYNVLLCIINSLCCLSQHLWKDLTYLHCHI